MLTGKRFQLERATLSIETHNDKPKAVTIPGGSILEVISGPNESDGLVAIEWEGRKLSMFAVDVAVRGTEVIDSVATGKSQSA